MSDYDPNYIPKKTYFLVSQKAIILNQKNDILLLQRSDKVESGGKWNLPGGGFEEGEQPTDSIKREIVEEVGIEVVDINPFGFYSFKNKEDNLIVIYYKSKIPSTDIKLNWEHESFRWVTREEALGMDITEVTRYFFENYEI